MDKAEYEDFVNAFTSGKLVKPEQSGHVIARVAIDPRKDLSGKNLKYVQPQPTVVASLTRDSGGTRQSWPRTRSRRR